MTEHAWIKEFPAAITVCDEAGIMLEMNDKAAKTFEKDGGRFAKLIGLNMLDCHPDPAREKTERLLAARVKNVYTIEKNSIKKRPPTMIKFGRNNRIAIVNTCSTRPASPIMRS